MSLSPPRLGFLIDDLEGRGGTELHLLTLLGGLHRAGFATELVILGRAGLAHLFEREGTRVHRWLVRRVITPGYPLLVARLAGLLRRRRFDLLETIHVAADLLGPPAAQAAGIPCVSSRRDLGIFRSPRHLLLSRLVRRFVTAFLAPSEAVRDFACRQEKIAPDRFLVVHNGVDIQRFRPGGEPLLRRSLGIPATAPVVGTVASLSPAKQPLLLLEAFVRLVRGPLPGAHLVLAGHGPLATLVALAVQAEGLQQQVHLLGMCNEPEQVYASLDVHALASSSEGFSNTLLEAMACGLPVVATRVGGNPEVVQDGVCGLLVPPDDGPALASALALVLQQRQLAATLGERARQRILRSYTVERMIGAHAALYRTLLSPRRGARAMPPGELQRQPVAKATSGPASAGEGSR